MSSDDRLYRLGLLHLKDKPEELRVELEKRLEVYEARRRALAAKGIPVAPGPLSFIYPQGKKGTAAKKAGLSSPVKEGPVEERELPTQRAKA